MDCPHILLLGVMSPIYHSMAKFSLWPKKVLYLYSNMTWRLRRNSGLAFLIHRHFNTGTVFTFQILRIYLKEDKRHPWQVPRHNYSGNISISIYASRSSIINVYPGKKIWWKFKVLFFIDCSRNLIGATWKTSKKAVSFLSEYSANMFTNNIILSETSHPFIKTRLCWLNYRKSYCCNLHAKVAFKLLATTFIKAIRL